MVWVMWVLCAVQMTQAAWTEVSLSIQSWLSWSFDRSQHTLTYSGGTWTSSDTVVVVASSEPGSDYILHDAWGAIVATGTIGAWWESNILVPIGRATGKIEYYMIFTKNGAAHKTWKKTLHVDKVSPNMPSQHPTISHLQSTNERRIGRQSATDGQTSIGWYEISLRWHDGTVLWTIATTQTDLLVRMDGYREWSYGVSVVAIDALGNRSPTQRHSARYRYPPSMRKYITWPSSIVRWSTGTESQVTTQEIKTSTSDLVDHDTNQNHQTSTQPVTTQETKSVTPDTPQPINQPQQTVTPNTQWSKNTNKNWKTLQWRSPTGATKNITKTTKNHAKTWVYIDARDINGILWVVMQDDGSIELYHGSPDMWWAVSPVITYDTGSSCSYTYRGLIIVQCILYVYMVYHGCIVPYLTNNTKKSSQKFDK